MKAFFFLPFWIRVTFVLFLFIVILWLILGKIILRILSVIPFLLRKVCWGFYLLLEMPIALLHKKFGLSFGKMDNAFSCMGEKVDTVVQKWYTAWHISKKIHLGRLLLVYFACVAYIVFPSLTNVDNKIVTFGETLYTTYETHLINWLEEHELYDSLSEDTWSEKEQLEEDVIEPETEIIEDNFYETILIVSGVNTSLLIRDIPSLEKCIVLERLQNDDTVTWKGELTFAKADNDHVEPWVKVVTMNGTEGWCRLFYLHPDAYEGRTFYITDIENEE